jgi:hypothetical protein
MKKIVLIKLHQLILIKLINVFIIFIIIFLLYYYNIIYGRKTRS